MFFTIISIEIVVLSASYLIYRTQGITFQQEAILLIIFGCILSTVVSLSIIWAIQLIISVYRRNAGIKTKEEFNTLTDLNVAIENHQLKLFFQPQSNLQTDEIIVVEWKHYYVWQHPKKGILMPNDFIPIAEKSGLIQMISEWTLLQACIQNKILIDEGYNLRVAVNISPLLFKDMLLIEHVSQILEISKLPAKRFRIRDY